MRVSDEVVIELALRTLEDVASKADTQPVKRSFGIRLALAYLASRSDCQRWPFDSFWQWIVWPEPVARRTNVNSALNGIYLQVGRRREI